MTEYLYDAIHAISGEDICITAEITDADGNNVESGCCLVVFDGDCSLYYKTLSEQGKDIDKLDNTVIDHETRISLLEHK